jgi:hypothetical protein
MPKKSVTKKVAPALARVNAREIAAKTKRLAEEGRADVALIQRRRARIMEDFYDVGEALVRLKRPGVAAAMGYRSFADLCSGELAMSVAKADELIRIVAHVGREDAVRFGQDRTAALLALADATPEEDSPAILEKAVLRLPSGKKLDVAKASARALLEGAKEIRAAGGKTRRGRTTTPAERAACAHLQAELRHLGVKEARVEAVATKPGQEASARIDRVPVSMLAGLGKAIAATKKQTQK